MTGSYTSLGWERPYSAGPMTAEQFDRFWKDGFVIMDALLTKGELQPSLDAIAGRVDGLAQRLHKLGKVKDPASDADVYTQLVKLEQQFPEASVLIHKDGSMPRAFAELWSNPKLLAVAKQLLGPDVMGHPNWSLRAKTPRQEAADVPWHQDTAYLEREAWQTLQVTAWIPLLDTHARNGCLQVLRGGHRTGRTVRHTGCVGNTWYVRMDEEAAARELGVDFEKDCVTCEVPMGSVLLLNNLVPHRSLENSSSQVRWSLDLRWQRPGEPLGGWGVKDGILMLRADDPSYEVDWGNWLALDKKSGTEQPPDLAGSAEAAELSTVLVGPWLDIWETTHENKHTRAWQALKHTGSEHVDVVFA